MVVVKKPTYPAANLAAPYEAYRYDRDTLHRFANANKDDPDDVKAKNKAIESVFAFHSLWKYANGILAMGLYIVALSMAIVTLTKDYAGRKFPTTVMTHIVHPWDELGKLDTALRAIPAGGTAMSNVEALWAWSKCDQYLTAHNVPLQTDPYTLAPISASNPVWMPGGCNCIAQVAHSMGAGWTAARTTAPTIDSVKDMIGFCVYEGEMPHNYEALQSGHRPLFYFYAFMLAATSAVAISNFMHDSGATTVKEMVKQGNASDQMVSNQFWKLLIKLIVYALFGTATILAFTVAYYTNCNSCAADLHSFYWGVPFTFLIVYFAIMAAFVIPYIYHSGSKSVQDALSAVVQMENDRYTIVYRRGEDKAVYMISDALNAQAQVEHIWLDAMLIPAMVILAVGVALTRQWTDDGILYYYGMLVLFYTVVSTSADWMTSFWTRSLRLVNDLGMKGNAVYEYYQGYKDMVTYVQLFILVALVFTAVPSESITPYSYVLFFNWFYFIGMLFGVYMLPDIINDRARLNMHTVTAIKEFVVLLFVAALLITIMLSEALQKDYFSYTGIP